MTTLLARARAIRHSNTWIYSTMLFSALVSLTASLVLSIDAVELARNPTADLSCNINSVVSCGAVGLSWQAQLLGFPNAFLGLIAEPVVITIAVAALGGVRFPRWFMIAAQTVYTLGLIFAYWLFYQAIVNIGALCPWCLLVTVSTTVVWVSLTHVNIRDDYLPMPRAWRGWAREAIANDIDLMVVVAWLLVLALIIVTHYGAALFS
ncbi:vitamin K epoxide reductase family protein [Actinoplanes flavus]|uniref:Vitamin K epoxide reductase family protein n=1 Tax=Actinoplanes flavus TaxID=2820290 RepID=A0ABS3UGA1_9ACTN|nr:vitamin K epoxide reductase family protein [Actinoplanes flavus]MBO3737783.1 vitamin K epoxide reductase family protein [Actinoplanes flavus]